MNIRLGAGSACVAAAVAGAALGGPAADARAAAAAAGTLFEAAPFVLAAWLVALGAPHAPQAARRFAPWIGLAGCGCTRGPLPGALAVPAVALCAIAFGPLVAAARTATALALVAFGRSQSARGEHRSSPAEAADPFAMLATLGTSAFIAGLALEALGASGARLPSVAGLALGLVLGALAPCATAGVAIAAGFAHGAPWIAAGMLASTGLIDPFRLGGRRPYRETESEQTSTARVAGVLLAIALAVLAFRGPSGLVNPRLLVPIACGSIAAFACCGTLRTRLTHPWLVPAIMLACAVAPQPVPAFRAQATTLDDAFPGESLLFTGAAGRSGARTTLARYVITCCRIDAAPVAVRLDRPLAVRDGTWIRARGTLVRESDGTLALRADDVRTISAPADPYLYR